MSMIQLLAGSPPQYIPFAASGDGNDYMTMTTTPTGLSNSKVFTFSAWVDFTGGDGVLQRMLSLRTSVMRFAISKNTSNLIGLFGVNAAGTTILSLTSTNTIVAASGWNHIYACIDMANTSNRKIYINGVSETLIVTTYTNDTIEFVPGGGKTWAVLAGGDGTGIMTGSISEMWFNDAYLDNPDAFYSGGKPVRLGTTGQNPTGSTPVFYFSRNGDGNSWNVNAGTGGNMTITGSFGSPTPP